MIVTVFRSRLRPGVQEEYLAMVARMREIAVSMPGYVSHKGYWADDGERVTVVEFESEDALRGWRMHPEHREAQRLGREKFYTHYHVTVCQTLREARFTLANDAGAESNGPEA